LLIDSDDGSVSPNDNDDVNTCDKHDHNQNGGSVSRSPADADAPDRAFANIFSNIQVYVIAEYYDIPQLKRRAVDKLQARVYQKGGWCADSLTLALRQATSLVRDGDTLHRLLWSAATEHAAALLAHAPFTQLLRAGGDFAEHFAAALAAQRTRDLAMQRRQLEGEQRRHAAKEEALRAARDEAKRQLAAERNQPRWTDFAPSIYCNPNSNVLGRSENHGRNYW
jgi:hypothetical protein